MNAFCTQCNSPISCNPGHNCWCSDLPHTLPIPDPGTSGCLCRNCLTSKLDLHTTNQHGKKGAVADESA